ncbi:MAG: phosphate ABC transporter ATP-binding protein PstB [Chloroflexi bacterium]|nr:phosphate ABC transporter ATP-binding protein PstB [Chloroflexota bacterium]
MENLQNNIVYTENASVFYDNKAAVKDITLGFSEKSITSIIGPSGCGKSTYLRAINRMNDLIGNSKASGTWSVFGKDIYDKKTDVSTLRKEVGMVFQKPNPFPMSIYENMVFGPKQHGAHKKDELNILVEECLRKAALWDEVKDKLKESALSLSGGQQQRLCIARALAVKPKVILMDEPCSALDPIATLKIEELMRQLASEYTIIAVTHNMQQAARISDRVVFFLNEGQGGELVECGSADDIFTNPKNKKTEDYVTGRFG